MPYENLILDAIDVVLSWNLSEAALSQSGVVQAEASLLAGCYFE